MSKKDNDNKLSEEGAKEKSIRRFHDECSELLHQYQMLFHRMEDSIDQWYRETEATMHRMVSRDKSMAPTAEVLKILQRDNIRRGPERWLRGCLLIGMIGAVEDLVLDIVEQYAATVNGSSLEQYLKKPTEKLPKVVKAIEYVEEQANVKILSNERLELVYICRVRNIFCHDRGLIDSAQLSELNELKQKLESVSIFV